MKAELNVSIVTPHLDEVKEKSQPCGGGCQCPSMRPQSRSIQIAGEILLSFAAGEYSQEQAKGAWEILEALLKQHFSR